MRDLVEVEEYLFGHLSVWAGASSVSGFRGPLSVFILTYKHTLLMRRLDNSFRSSGRVLFFHGVENESLDWSRCGTLLVISKCCSILSKLV